MCSLLPFNEPNLRSSNVNKIIDMMVNFHLVNQKLYVKFNMMSAFGNVLMRVYQLTCITYFKSKQTRMTARVAVDDDDDVQVSDLHTMRFLRWLC